VSLEREMFPAWIGGRGLYGYRGGGHFLDIGTPGDYETAGQFFAEDTTAWHRDVP
jgi:NDP-sugar pyrophosphorylase family protein